MPSDKDQDAAVERWLRDEAVPAYDDHKADPNSAVPLDQSIARLRAYMDAADNHGAENDAPNRDP